MQGQTRHDFTVEYGAKGFVLSYQNQLGHDWMFEADEVGKIIRHNFQNKSLGKTIFNIILVFVLNFKSKNR